MVQGKDPWDLMALDDELDLGNEDNSSFLGDLENLDLEMLNVSLLLLGYT